MNIAMALRQACADLEIISDSPRLDAELIFAFALKRTRTYLYSHGDEELSFDQQRYLSTLIKIRQQSIPIAYIIGEKEFWSLKFSISPTTLIPRPATECLIEYILQHYPQNQALKVCDLGTGSGAIAVSLAKERSLWDITAVDIQASALAMAEYNARQHHCLNIHFYCSHWFTKIPAQQFDIIISNPPYINANDPHLKTGDVQHEPSLALQSPEQGLHDLKHLILHSQSHLSSQGLLILEHGYDQQEQVLAALKQQGFKNIQGLCDHDKLPRFCVAYCM